MRNKVVPYCIINKFLLQIFNIIPQLCYSNLVITNLHLGVLIELPQALQVIRVLLSFVPDLRISQTLRDVISFKELQEYLVY